MSYRVSGSDMNDTEITRHLAEIGCAVKQGHRADNLGESDVVVVSSAIKGYNPEVEAARARQIPVIPRAEMLGELMRMKFGIAVAGTHGKTTSTTMMHTVMMAAGHDPTAVIGGRVNSLGLANARWGKSDYLVAEADESDGSFLTLSPTLAIVTNIDAEHLDHYGSHAGVKDAFVEFANKIPFYGLAIMCMDHPHVQEIVPRVGRRVMTYGVSRQADFRARHEQYLGFSTRFEATKRGEPLGEFTVRMPGAHNVLNALAVIAVADELEVPLDVVKEAIAGFHGVQRRFTVVSQPTITRGGKTGDVLLIDDYGHHPAEVEVTLDAAQRGFERRVVVAFQPHRYTRTRDLFGEFTRAFNKADVLLVTEVYAAGEAPIAGANGEHLANAIRAHGHKNVRYVADKKDVATELEKIVRPGDIVFALGAGDINAQIRELSKRLEAEAKDPA